ncbi:hypothetical protein LMTR13_09295 [Bradyrhizobium icense]|uniref:Uncharacterized protein n=1 Tax=Bradyrhizobium icense TaxID=1274631 RepID=A0A1B1UC54_9BRAD|nr:hypothetical protein LMTR13_09295 [Bradyrhizobium icense]
MSLVLLQAVRRTILAVMLWLRQMATRRLSPGFKSGNAVGNFQRSLLYQAIGARERRPASISFLASLECNSGLTTGAADLKIVESSVMARLLLSLIEQARLIGF